MMQTLAMVVQNFVVLHFSLVTTMLKSAVTPPSNIVAGQFAVRAMNNVVQTRDLLLAHTVVIQEIPAAEQKIAVIHSVLLRVAIQKLANANHTVREQPNVQVQASVVEVVVVDNSKVAVPKQFVRLNVMY